MLHVYAIDAPIYDEIGSPSYFQNNNLAFTLIYYIAGTDIEFQILSQETAAS